MNYQIIKDRDILDKFVEWLPELEPNETYFIALFARRKYCKEIMDIGADKQQLKRLTCNKKELIAEKLHQLECEVGAYTKRGMGMPQESLAVYINPNPRDYKRATHNSLIRLANLIAEGDYHFNPHQEVLSQIQTACKRKIWMDFDFDVPYTNEIGFVIVQAIGLTKYQILVTKNGFHLLINTTTIPSSVSKTWYQNIVSLPGIDIRGDNLIPIPGCTQGNFVPYFYA